MGYSVNRGTHRIPLKEFDGSDNWVDIKSDRSGADTDAIMAAAELQVDTSGNLIHSGNPVALSRLHGTVLQRAVVQWSLKADDADSEPMPLTWQVFTEELPLSLTRWLSDAISGYYDRAKPSPETLGNSPAP